MPRMNGLEFIGIARKKYPHMAFVMVSGSDLNNDIEDAIEKGLIEDYIHKPFEASAIEETIQKLL